MKRQSTRIIGRASTAYPPRQDDRASRLAGRRAARFDGDRFGHLSPKDVITLTRTSKILRETLLSRNATTVWKAALSREDVPECPSWMTEPAWASLLFEPVCQVSPNHYRRRYYLLILVRLVLWHQECTRSRLSPGKEGLSDLQKTTVSPHAMN